MHANMNGNTMFKKITIFTTCFDQSELVAKLSQKGGSPGLVVMGGDSCSENCGFESPHHILDGHFSHEFAIKLN